MTKEELAGKLTGREYRSEITPEEEDAARVAGLVVVFGTSDDLVECRGAIDDEAGAYGGKTLHVDCFGIIPSQRDDDWDDEKMASYFRRRDARPVEITALWCAEGGYSWTYETDIPHATFEILEDGEPYCRGIVFELR